MAQVRIDHIVKVYPGNVKAVDDVSLHIHDREFIVLVGPSGCGKSTTLRMVAGLEDITGGTISIGDRIVNDVPPKDRDIAMVFQNYALYPHMTVYKNMAFGLKLRRTPRKEIDTRVRDAARVLGIEHLLERKPKALSGGQRQRVAVGRAIVRDPACFLFDEPLSNLDAKLRVETRAELKRLHKRLQTTTIYVTHDQEEAMTLGDRVVVMADGVIRQADTPLKVYNEPADRFVASFLGTPPMNFLEGRLEGTTTSGLRFIGGGFDVALPAELARRVADHAGRDVVLGIRPEGFYLRRNEAATDEDATVAFRVDVVEPLGNTMDIYGATSGIDTPADQIPVHDPAADAAATREGNGSARGQSTADGGDGHAGPSHAADGRHLVARVKAERIEEGRIVKMYLDMTKAHIFEPGPFGLNLSLPQRVLEGEREALVGA